MKEPVWLQKNVIMAFHEMLLAEHGGAPGMRDEGLLESALGRPINQFYYEQSTTILELATTYAVGIIQNHPFVDGNKRTAFVSAKTFLARNGFWLKYPRTEAVNMFFSIAARETSDHALKQALEKYSVKLIL
jgi:death on curing protein